MKGLKRWIDVRVPALFVLMGILVVCGMVAGDTAGGLGYLFVPDWKRLVTNAAGGAAPRPILEAMPLFLRLPTEPFSATGANGVILLPRFSPLSISFSGTPVVLGPL